MRDPIYIDSPGGIDIAGPGPCLSIWDGDGQTTVYFADEGHLRFVLADLAEQIRVWMREDNAVRAEGR